MAGLEACLIATDTPGRFYIMPCPPAAALGPAIDALAAMGVAAVVSMLPQDEAAMLGVSDEGALCADAGMAFISAPIADFGLPDTAMFDVLVADLASRLRGGDSIAVHCKAGVGRSGMVTAAVLIALGHTAAYAVEAISAARGKPIPDTREQREFISRYAVRAG